MKDGVRDLGVPRREYRVSLVVDVTAARPDDAAMDAVEHILECAEGQELWATVEDTESGISWQMSMRPGERPVVRAYSTAP